MPSNHNEIDLQTSTLTLEHLWKETGFNPNTNQREAILHVDGPLYLPAGPGSGKTRVLLWRTLNLCVFHHVRPEQIFLATFTDKAAFQLKEGLKQLLGLITNHTGETFDSAAMYIGTIHSLCQRMIMDRRFYPSRQRGKAPSLLDELSQYFYLYAPYNWKQLTAGLAFSETPFPQINELFESRSASKHEAVKNCIALFNRLSEECIDPSAVLDRTSDPVLQELLKMYARYKKTIQAGVGSEKTDFSLLQQKALAVLEGFNGTRDIFKHVIIDEYQDTNTIQERIFFQLARGTKNICAVGDDDQAMYRFRGATVENFVQFSARCESYLHIVPTQIPLNINYRSRKNIVSFYCDFMNMCNWRNPALPSQSYRVENKNIQSHSEDIGISVISTSPATPEIACAEVAQLVWKLLDSGKVENANQIAFLFPSLKYQGEMTRAVQHMKEALEKVGLKVYAPRAGRFLDVAEVTDIFGIFLHVFGKPSQGDFAGNDYNRFHKWLEKAYNRGTELLHKDKQMALYIKGLRNEIATVIADYIALLKVAERNNWNVESPYNLVTMKRVLANTSGLSNKAKQALVSSAFEKVVLVKQRENTPLTLEYVIRRATSLDWNVLDLFYRILGFDHFKCMIDLAEAGEDEGPICTLGLVSQYLARYMDQYSSVLTANLLVDEKFQHRFFSSYIFALFRLGESEYQDDDDPFPKGRIPFITIHQAKGLEFPVVVLGSLRKDDRGPQPVEKLVGPLMSKKGEPQDRMAEFDIMRMFYVALSRAKNLVVLSYYKSQGNRVNVPFKKLVNEEFPRVASFDISSLPTAKLSTEDLPGNYSYTSDYLLYLKCPRQYMLFRKYGFIPSQTRMMMFGTLVHQTIDDLHQYLIAKKEKVNGSAR